MPYWYPTFEMSKCRNQSDMHVAASTCTPLTSLHVVSIATLVCPDWWSATRPSPDTRPGIKRVSRPGPCPFSSGLWSYKLCPDERLCLTRWQTFCTSSSSPLPMNLDPVSSLWEWGLSTERVAAFHDCLDVRGSPMQELQQLFRLCEDLSFAG